MLNINILIEHLNCLDSDKHDDLIVVLFTNRYDFSTDWRGKLNQFVEQVCEANSNGISEGRPAEWWAFFLHIAASAGWYEREKAAELFTANASDVILNEALQLVLPARARSVDTLVAEILQSMEAQ